MEQQNKMGTAKMGPLIFSMALPAMISMIINALYNIVDSIFVAKYSHHYGDGHRQMPYIRFVSCSGYYHFIYSQVPGNACAVLCSLRKSRHCPKAGYRKE